MPLPRPSGEKQNRKRKGQSSSDEEHLKKGSGRPPKRSSRPPPVLKTRAAKSKVSQKEEGEDLVNVSKDDEGQDGTWNQVQVKRKSKRKRQSSSDQVPSKKGSNRPPPRVVGAVGAKRKPKAKFFVHVDREHK
jgi:hypothetical protein